jgi:hypothetical protein
VDAVVAVPDVPLAVDVAAPAAVFAPVAVPDAPLAVDAAVPAAAFAPVVVPDAPLAVDAAAPAAVCVPAVVPDAAAPAQAEVALFAPLAVDHYAHSPDVHCSPAGSAARSAEAYWIDHSPVDGSVAHSAVPHWKAGSLVR